MRVIIKTRDVGSVNSLIKLFPEIDDINYKGHILVFTEGYSQEEYDKIYDLLANKWKVNKLGDLDRIAVKNGSRIVYDTYKNNHSLIKRQLILVENCDLYAIHSAFDLYEYLDMDYDLYIIRPEIE